MLACPQILEVFAARNRAFISLVGFSRRQCACIISPCIAFPMTSSSLSIRKHSRAWSTKTFTSPKIKRLPRNDEIKEEIISVVDESGKISGPHRTAEFLEDFDFENKSLVTILEGNAEDGRYPLCRIMDRSALRQIEMTALKSKGKKKGTPTKIIEMSWAVENHDLETKLRRLREFLEKGCNVNLLLQAKKRGRSVTKLEGENIIQKILETVEEAGGKQQKPPEGEILNTMDMSFTHKKQN
ncbi:Translation initiation factor IF-3 [Golovinomyces cichoracearum]|uniref:Translation initiation factor IF-3 n=1 Tax=Golovinomyces cichoracearum TaxID=62708 RepID=A0A420HQA5_9PEZI|nr:Translation initiation factor IF-3 [Golovinomyces cichoracearum]